MSLPCLTIKSVAPLGAFITNDFGTFKLDDPPPVSRNVLPAYDPRSSLMTGVNAPTFKALMRAFETVQLADRLPCVLPLTGGTAFAN